MEVEQGTRTRVPISTRDGDLVGFIIFEPSGLCSFVHHVNAKPWECTLINVTSKRMHEWLIERLGEFVASRPEIIGEMVNGA